MTPRGIYLVKRDEEEEVDETLFTEIEKEEEIKEMNLDHYKIMDNWLHLYPNILIQGRINHQELRFPEDTEIEDEEKETIKKKAI